MKQVHVEVILERLRERESVLLELTLPNLALGMPIEEASGERETGL